MNEDYQAVNLRELVILILRKWWIILICMSITTALTYWINVTYTVPIYRAQATLFIGKDASVVANINVNDIKINNELVSDYRELLRSRLVVEDVIEDLEHNVYFDQLVKNLNVFTIEGTRFMYVSFDDTNPQRAADISNAFSEVLIEKAEDIVGVQNISIVDYAILPKKPINTSYMMNVIIGALVGIIIAILIVFVLLMVDTTVKEEKFIEDVVGLPIIGKIPKFDGEAKDK